MVGETKPLAYKETMSNITKTNSSSAELLGAEEGTTVPEWRTRVRNILEGEERESESIVLPEDVYLAPCRICGKTPTGTFAISKGIEKYQYECLRCGNLGDILATEFATRRAWNMENGGQVATVLREINETLLYSTNIVRTSLEEASSKLDIICDIDISFNKLVLMLEETRRTISNIIENDYGRDASIKVRVEGGTLSGMLTSDIPETISVINGSGNEVTRTIETGVYDITCALDMLATAIKSK